jgi:hypothetical protein
LVRHSADVVEGVLVVVVKAKEGVINLKLVPGGGVHLCANIH